MLLPVLLFQVATATPPAPVVARPKTLSELAAERKGKTKPAGGFSAAESREPPPTPSYDAQGYLVRPKTPTPGAPDTAAKVPAGLAVQTPTPQEYWRERNVRLRGALATAQVELFRMEKEIPVVSCIGNGCPTSLVLAGIETTRDAALAPYRLRVRDAQAAVDALPEECRRDRECQPGWVR